MTLHPRMIESLALAPLVRDVDLLCLDAGNTVVFLDHARLSALAAREGFAATPEALIAAEGQTKLALERGGLPQVAWSGAAVPARRGWGATVGSILALAGLPRREVPRLLDALWPEHAARNLWSLVPPGLVDALGRARARGLRVAVISNSEGMLEALLRDVGLLGALDLVVDSGVVGIEKPDPRIFRIALDRFEVPPSRALHLGDIYATDVLGARAAGVRVALVDPYGHLAGTHPDVPRVPGAKEVADALAEAAIPLGRRIT
jgi:putative hydrolase of the HAD superfamily